MASGGGGGGGAAGGVSVPALWSEVNRYGQNGDFTRALKAVNKSECQGGRWAGRAGGRMRSPSGARDHLGADAGREDPAASPGLEPLAAAVGLGRGSGCRKLALGLGVFRATCTFLFTPLGKQGRDFRSPLLPAPRPNCSLL